MTPTVTAPPAEALPIDRYVAEWQGRIAVTAAEDGGLDTFRAALAAIKQRVPLDRGQLEHAKTELWDAGVRHLGPIVSREVLAAIYTSVLADDPPDAQDELDASTAEHDHRRDIRAEIARLAKLAPIDYDREREAAATELGCRVGTLDEQVKAARADSGSKKGQGRSIELAEIEPWRDAVDGADLLNAVAAAISNYVVLADTAADAVALWCVATHTFDTFGIFPRLTLSSPTPRCGKTTLRDVVAALVAKPLSADSILAAALFRTIEVARPTLLLDEADTYLDRNEDLRGIINSGHRRDGCVIRCVGDDHEPRQFSTWAPVLVAQIGKPPATVYDRSIVIKLRRRTPSEHVERFRGRSRQDLGVLAQKAARWTRDNSVRLARAEPAALNSLDDRANDNWHSLLAIADAAGGHWPQRARAAATELADSAGHDAASTGEMLLADIRWLFDGKSEERDHRTVTEYEPVDKMSSAELADRLAEMEGRPWAEWRAGKPINQNSLARLLRTFGIASGTIRLDSGQTPKGYKREDFRDVFARYGDAQSATPPQPSNGGHIHALESATTPGDVALRKSKKPNNHRHCGGVAVYDGIPDDADIPAEGEAVL